MTRVFSAQNPLMVDHLKLVLEAEGVPCVVQRRNLSSAAGQLPPVECWTELWLVNDTQRADAERIVARALRDPIRGGETWDCPRCGERLEMQFEICWKCLQRQGSAAEADGGGEVERLPTSPMLRRERVDSARVVAWLAWVAMALVTGFMLWADRASR